MTSMTLTGIELRYVLTRALALSGPMTVAELVKELDRQGFTVKGRPTKAVSDALRWERQRGRVRRLAHGLYGPGAIPRSTEYRIIERVKALRRMAAGRAEASLLFDDW
jgi:hypothetical protein